MARILIVGCGCRGRGLAASLVDDGHRVRGTTRSPGRVAAIEATGSEAVVADPDRLGTLLCHLDGVSVVCWLMGSATGDADSVAALHGPRLRSMLAKLVDTPVRGLVYEAAGTVPARVLRGGGAIAREAALTHRMPVQVVDQGSVPVREWIVAMTSAARAILTA